MASAIVLQAQKESHRNLPQFTGDLSQDVDEYIKKIEGIGALTKEPEEVLHVLLTTIHDTDIVRHSRSAKTRATRDSEHVLRPCLSSLSTRRSEHVEQNDRAFSSQGHSR